MFRKGMLGASCVVVAVVLTPSFSAAASAPAPASVTTAAIVIPAATNDTPPPTTDPSAGTSSRGFFGSLFHNLGDDIKHIPRKNSIYWLATETALALAIHPADDDINRRLSGSDFADALFVPGKYIGSFPVMFGASLTTYLAGRHRHVGWVQHLGMDMIEATLLSEGITQGIKVAVRRDRPLRADGTRANGFSFPSGHASVTFAVATVFQQHIGWKAAVPTYLVASYVAMSRLHDERHFASDVVAGATEGIIVGRSVTWHGRNYYASPMLLPHGAGVMVAMRQPTSTPVRAPLEPCVRARPAYKASGRTSRCDPARRAARSHCRNSRM
jgi:membrane-associated phospholipid phosphatase